MRLLSTFIVLVLAGLGVYAMWREGWTFVPPAYVERVERAVAEAQLPIDRLTRITLYRDGKPLARFERDAASSGTSGVSGAGGWNQTEPVFHPMDAFSIRQLAVQALELEQYQALEPSALAADQLSAESLKLAPPAAQVVYEWPEPGAGVLRLNLGRRSVAGRAYLRINDEPTIRVVSPGLHERALEIDPKEWRDRTIFQNVSPELDQIQWRTAETALTLAREGKTWKMLEPAATRVDRTALDDFFQDLGRARVVGFILDQPNDVAQFGLNNPVLIVTLTQGGNVQRLLIGSRSGGGGAGDDRFAMLEGRPVIVKLSGAVIAALYRQPRALAEPTGSGVNGADVKSIVIRQAGSELKLERDLERWLAPDLGGKEVNAADVNDLLAQLTELRASEVQFKEYPRDLEVATITLHGFDAKPLDTVRIAKEKDTGRWALENGDNVLRIFPASMQWRLTVADFGLP